MPEVSRGAWDGTVVGVIAGALGGELLVDEFENACVVRNNVVVVVRSVFLGILSGCFCRAEEVPLAKLDVACRA